MRRRGRGRKRPVIRGAAEARIRTLYRLSFSKAREGDMEIARRYLKLARKISMRYNVRTPRDLMRATCKECMAPLVPGVTSRTRQRNSATVITCLQCGKKRRFVHGGNTDEDE